MERAMERAMERLSRGCTQDSYVMTKGCPGVYIKGLILSGNPQF